MEHWFCSGLKLPVFYLMPALEVLQDHDVVECHLWGGRELLKLGEHEEWVQDCTFNHHKVVTLQSDAEAVQRAHT